MVDYQFLVLDMTHMWLVFGPEMAVRLSCLISGISYICLIFPVFYTRRANLAGGGRTIRSRAGASG